jgi:adenylate cyclase
LSSQVPVSSAKNRAFILLDGPGHSQTRLAIKDGITSLGRLPSNDLILLGDLVSRNHARLLYFNGKVAVQDMGSHNGCWVNGEKVSNAPIDARDTLRVGDYSLTFVFEGGAITEPPAPLEFQYSSSDTDTDAVDIPRPTTKTSPDSGPRKLPWDVDYRHRDESQALRFEQSQEQSKSLSQALLLAMLKASEAFASAADLDDYAQKITEILVSELRVSACGYYKIEDDDQSPQLHCSSGPALKQGGTLSASQSVLRSATSRRHTIFSKDISDDIRFNKNESVLTSAPNMRALICVPVLTAEQTLGALYLSREAEDQFCDREIDVVESVARLFASGLLHFSKRQRQITDELNRANLSRFHGPQVVDHIIEDAIDRKSLDTRPAVVCAIRLCGLSALAEHVSGEDITRFLNNYHHRMSALLFSGHGTICKREAGQITAIFGAPYSTGKDGLRAASNAKAMLAALEEMTRSDSKFQGLGLSIGLSQGRVLCGFVGEAPNREFTAIGRAVDTAERLRDSARVGKIVLSAELEPQIKTQHQTAALSTTAMQTEPEGLARFVLVED